MCMRCARLAGILAAPKKRGIKPGHLRAASNTQDTDAMPAPPESAPRPPLYRTVDGVEYEVTFDGTWRD